MERLGDVDRADDNQAEGRVVDGDEGVPVSAESAASAESFMLAEPQAR